MQSREWQKGILATPPETQLCLTWIPAEVPGSVTSARQRRVIDRTCTGTTDAAWDVYMARHLRSASMAPVWKPLFRSDDSLAFKKPKEISKWCEKLLVVYQESHKRGGSKKDFTRYQNRARPVKWYVSHERGGNTPLVTQRAETHLSCLWQFSTDWETVFTEEHPTRLVAPLLSTRASEQNVEAFGVFRNIWRFLWWTKSVWFMQPCAWLCVCVCVCVAGHLFGSSNLIDRSM